MSRSGRLGPISIAVIAFAVSAWTLSGCGSTEKKGSNVYKGHGVSFRYPHGWRQLKPHGLGQPGLWTVMVAPSSSPGADLAFLTAYRTPKVITRKNLASKKPSITSTVAGAAQESGGALRSGPTPITMGGLPGYGFKITIVASENRPSASRLVLVWKGKTEYFLNCQYLTKGVLGAEIERGCRMIVASFRLG
jgi:hypothetical protein